MLAAKQIADLITVTRAVIAFTLAWLGVLQGDKALSGVAWLTIAAWTSDAVDGPIARKGHGNHHTWVGDHDLEIDMLVSIGLLVYMVIGGFVGLLCAALYLLLWLLIFWRFRLQRSLGMLFQAPIYGWFIKIAVHLAPTAGWCLVVWIMAAVVLTWPQFPNEVVPGFLEGMRALSKRER